MKKIEIHNTVKLGEWNEVDEIPVSSIVKNDTSGAMLSGMIIKGYETKFGNKENSNGEVFETGCLDDFIDDYFINNKLNMPVDIMHRHDIDHLCGRVLLIEVNTVGFYFVVYVPKTYINYDTLKSLLKEGIIQGFSKDGYSSDYDVVYNEDGSFSHYKINKMVIIRVSLVDIPANAVAFEKVQETKIENSLSFVKNIPENMTIDQLLTN